MRRRRLGWWGLIVIAVGGLGLLTALHPFLWPVLVLAGLSLLPAEKRHS